MKKLLPVLAIALGLCLGNFASATPISGQIDLAKLGNTVSLDTTTNTVTFTTNGAGYNALVNDASGSYLPYMGLQNVTYFTFTYDPFTGPQLIWSAPWGSFTLNTISVDSEVADMGIYLSGTGIASLTGYDDTFGRWSFSADRNSANARFNFSSTTSVPDGGMTAMLLGIGLMGLGIAARRRKA